MSACVKHIRAKQWVRNAFVLAPLLFSFRFTENYLLTTFGIETTAEEPYKMLYYVDRVGVITLIVGIIGAAPVFSWMIETRNRSHVHIALVNVWSLILFALSVSFMEASTCNPFICSRF